MKSHEIPHGDYILGTIITKSLRASSEMTDVEEEEGDAISRSRGVHDLFWKQYLEKKKELLANLYTHIIKEAKDDYSDVKWLLEMM